MNDLVVLPVVLVLIAVATDQSSGIGGWSAFMLKLLLLGPAIGFAVGGAGSWVMSWMDKKMSIRSEHQSLYVVGWCWPHIPRRRQRVGTGSWVPLPPVWPW